MDASPTPAVSDPDASGRACRGPGPGGPPQVLFVGRFDTTDPAGPKATWPGSRIVTRFSGTSVSVKLSEYAEDWMDGAPSYWDVSIDHAPPTVIAMIADNHPHVFELASNLSPGEHEVELYKRSEMQTGITQFLGFDFHGGRSLPAPARAAAPHRGDGRLLRHGLRHRHARRAEPRVRTAAESRRAARELPAGVARPPRGEVRRRPGGHRVLGQGPHPRHLADR